MDATGKPSSLATRNDGAAKSQILDFVARVTEPGEPEFVPPAERIATFDNDGTLWCEQPLFVRAFFLMDRVRALAGKDPTLNEHVAIGRHEEAGREPDRTHPASLTSLRLT